MFYRACGDGLFAVKKRKIKKILKTPLSLSTHIDKGRGVFMKRKFILSGSFAMIWLLISVFFAVYWAQEIGEDLPVVYVWWVIIGIALLPGFLMSMMFFSNILNWKRNMYPDTDEDVTILMCAHNEAQVIEKAVRAVLAQKYAGNIRLIIVDNASEDHTKEKIEVMKKISSDCVIEYTYCEKIGKSNALNHGLAMVDTAYFITVDADTCLQKHAVQKIMNHIVSCKSACVAANLFVKNAEESFITKMQNYDYFLSIAAVKRFQGAYHSTLVAQGAFSAYNTKAVRAVGGWKNVMGEDIVLTYEMLEKGMKSDYEPLAVGYTIVPKTLKELYKQRKRWAIGMLEGLGTVPPWKQGNIYSVFFTMVNCSVIYLDLAFLFGFLPGLLLAFAGYYYFVGFCTLFTVLLSLFMYSSMYLYQQELGIQHEDSLTGFLCFFISFQIIQSAASLQGYISCLLGKKEKWK